MSSKRDHVKCISKGRLQATLDRLALSDQLKNLKGQLEGRLSGNLFLRIRNNLAFHYAEKMVDFRNLKSDFLDDDSYIYTTPQGYRGDLLSHISTLAIVDPLLGLAPLIPTSTGTSNSNTGPLVAYERVLVEVIEVAGLFCFFAADAFATLLRDTLPDLSLERITIPTAPEPEDEHVRFFVHPPTNLEELRTGETET
jgi:hypothetical protein